MSVDDALRDACPIRMRPVVMTSLTIILALLPAAIGLGAGAETNAPLSIAVIGGMITSTLLTLVVVPAGYSLVENWRERRRAARRRRGAALQSPQSPRDESLKWRQLRSTQPRRVLRLRERRARRARGEVRAVRHREGARAPAAKGTIVVKKAYCDWDRYKEFKATMHEAAFELIEIPHVRQSGKNSADIRMVVDALDLCYTKAHVDTFVIVSGDSDFSPLVSKLRENAKTVIGVGVKNSTSDLLIANCDEFIYYDDLVRDDEQKRRAAKKRKDAAPASAAATRATAATRSRKPST